MVAMEGEREEGGGGGGEGGSEDLSARDMKKIPRCIIAHAHFVTDTQIARHRPTD